MPAPTEKELLNLEEYLLKQQVTLGPLCEDEMIGTMINVIEQVKILKEDSSRIAAINRHFLNHFYGGDVLKMLKDFSYLKEKSR